MLLNSTLRTPLGGGLVLERSFTADRTLRIAVEDSTGTTVFAEDLALAAPATSPPAAETPEQVY